MQKSLGRYVRGGYGGSGNATRRFGGTAQTAGTLYGALSPSERNQTSLPGGNLDVAVLSGPDNVPALDSTYNGADLVVNKRLSDGWMLMAGASFGRTLGDIFCNNSVTCTAASSDLNNPNFAFRQGLVGNDVPVSLRVSGLYQMRWGVSVSATAQRFTGFPENTTVLVGGNTVKLTQVSQSLVVEPRGTTRPPPVHSLDVSLRKTWKVRNVAFEPVLDAYNLMNAASLLSRVTQVGPTYLTPVTIQRGRLIKLGVNVHF